MGERKAGIHPIPKQESIDLLGKVCSVLNESEIEYFLTCGTLLGYIREGDFIEWDSDIDLGVFEIKAFEEAIPKLESNKLIIKEVTHGHGFPMSLSYQITNAESTSDYPTHVDIFEFERTSRGIIFRMVNTKRIVESVRWFLLTPKDGMKEAGKVNHNTLEDLIEASALSGKWIVTINKLKKWVRENLLLSSDYCLYS